ncbi:MAG: hypothetical protein DDT22_01212 [candidate division WS2 bacterium]|nr:hypothetical protein [Candidatus Lithacetigena glycinireducens]
MSNQMKRTAPIHPEALRQLTGYAQEFINIAYYDGRRLEFKDVDRLIEATKKMENILKSSYLDIKDIYFFIYKELRSIASTLTSSNKFSDALSPEEIAEHRDNIINKLLSYPKEYQVFIPLPNVQLSLNGPLIISDTVSIIRADDTLISDLPPIEPPNKALPPLRLHDDTVCLTFCIKGFFGIPLSTSQEIVKSEYKKILASLIVAKILVRGSELGIIQGHGLLRATTICIYCLNEDSEALSFDLSLPESNFLHGFYLSASSKVLPKRYFRDASLSTLFHSNAHLTDDEKSQIDRVRTSLEWYYEGLINENETFSFILFCTAIEALLGSKKENAGITERLSDRISFLIARSAMERVAIKEDFLKAYDLRSNIIHRGKSKISRKERGSLYFLRQSLEEAIRKEMLLLPR